MFIRTQVLKRTFEMSETLCIDEFDASLHPLLVRYIFFLFNNSEINKTLHSYCFVAFNVSHVARNFTKKSNLLCGCRYKTY